MADSMSSDTNSEYHEDNLSDTSAERQSRFVIVGQKPNFDTSKNERNILQKLFTREIRGCLSKHKNAPQEKLFPTIPEWGHLPLLHIIPMSALQAGHIVMGMTQCGKFILTYTCSLDLRGNESAYKYSLHWWAFSPHRISKKVAEITLFGSYCISKELDVVVAQWPMETNKVVIHGLQSDWGNSQTTDKAYLTITKVPSLSNCRDCAKVAASYEEDELAANWDGCVQFNCLIHGLTVHTTYEVISPYPRFRASVCLKYWNHIVINTGNFLHVLRVDLIIPKINKNSNDNGSEDLINNKLINNDNIEQIIQVNVNDIYELDCYEINRKISTPESINGDELSPVRDNTSSSTLLCDDNNDNNVIIKICECYNNGDCDYCIKNNSLSVRDKILQDFCDDMTQELSIGSDSITLVKHPSCSPRSTPQRLPADLKQQWSILTPPSDILRTRTSTTTTTNEKSSLVNGRFNNNSKRSLSPQPGTSQEPTTIVSINSPLNTLSISPSPCSPRLMSPPITTSFRQRSIRKNSTSSSSSSSSAIPPPTSSTTTATTRTRSSHKLILEAEKAYEFTDDSLEPGEKLSSFRKRRLADKKYEFKVEAEDTENIIPFKHIRDQNEQRYCPIHRLNSVDITPAYSSNNTKWHCHRPDSENSESEDTSSQDVFNGCFKPVEPAEKSVLRPLSQNQLYSFFSSRDRYGKITHNDSPLAPKAFIPYPSIKCTAHFKRSFIELDDEMVSVITDVEDDETGGYVSYQYVLPMHVHGSGYVQMQMISNSKAEKMMLPYVSINQYSFDIETFSHHIAHWICKKFKKKYWHYSDYDIEIIDVCAITGDIICLLIMKIQASEHCTQPICSQERKAYEAGCKFMWNIESNQYKLTSILPMNERPTKLNNLSNLESNAPGPLWNPTRYIVPQLRKTSKQPYVRPVRFLQHSNTFSIDSLVEILDMDNLVSIYMTPLPDDTGTD